MNQLIAENGELREEIENLRERLARNGNGDNTLGIETERDSIPLEDFERRMAEI